MPLTTRAAGEGEGGRPAPRIEIPKIGVDKIVVAGVALSDLRKGPGHYPNTPLPGQLGNAAIAGHRTTYGAPFFRVDELAAGDEIIVTTVQGTFRYLVTEIKIVKPTDFSVLDPTPDATLTLTSCNPRYSSRQRIVVKARLDTTASATIPAARGSDHRSSFRLTTRSAAPRRSPGARRAGATSRRRERLRARLVQRRLVQ